MNFHASSLFLHCNSLKLHLPVLCSVYPALLPHVMEVRMSDLHFIYFCQYISPSFVAGEHSIHPIFTIWLHVYRAKIEISFRSEERTDIQREPGSLGHNKGLITLEILQQNSGLDEERRGEERRLGWTVLFISFDVPLSRAGWMWLVVCGLSEFF